MEPPTVCQNEDMTKTTNPPTARFTVDTSSRSCRLRDENGKTVARILARRNRNRYIDARLICFTESGRIVRCEGRDRDAAIEFALALLEGGDR